MKSKISKILGVTLTLVLLASMTVGIAAPVAADTLEWDKMSFPKAGSDGDYFRSDEITSVGPLAQGIDGAIYAAGGGQLASMFNMGSSNAGSSSWSSEQAYTGDDSIKIVAPAPAGDGDTGWFGYDVPAGLMTLSGVLAGSMYYYVYGTLGYPAYLKIYVDCNGDGVWSWPQDDYLTLEPYQWPDVYQNTAWGGVAFADGIESATANHNPLVSPWYPAGNWRGAPDWGTAQGTPQWLKVDLISSTVLYAESAYPGYGLSGADGIDDILLPASYWQAGVTTGSQADPDTAFTGGRGTYDYNPHNMQPSDDVLKVVIQCDDWVKASTCYVDDDTSSIEGESDLYMSDDGGRTWSKTKYDGGNIVAVVTSNEDADIVYVADTEYVYKSTNVSKKFSKVAPTSLDDLIATGGTNPGAITCLDVGYDADLDPFVFVGTKGAAAYDGDVYYIDETTYGAEWTALEVKWDEDGDSTVEADEDNVNVFSVGVCPGFASNDQIVALVTEEKGTDETWIINNDGTVGEWFDEVELEYDPGTSFVAEGASPIAFPEDFDADDNYELFVGTSDNSAGGGDVYRVLDSIIYDLDIDGSDSDTDICSLSLTGTIGDAAMMAGVDDDNNVFYSTDDGDDWSASKKDPTGDGPTYVLVADDYADSGQAWAGTNSTWTTGSAVSLTNDSGKYWNGISLICTGDTYDVEDLAFGSRFMVTDPTSGPSNADVWKYDGSYWERIECRADINLVQTSTEYDSDETVLIADSTTADIWRSTNSGLSWSGLATSPGASIHGWLAIDSTTFISSDGTDIWRTTDRGRTPWKDEGDGNLCSFVLSPDFASDETILAGGRFGDGTNDSGEVFISTNAGDSWKMKKDCGDYYTYVAFDPEFGTNETYYAGTQDSAGNMIIMRYDGDDWDTIYDDSFIGVNTSACHGLVCSPDGTLYAADGWFWGSPSDGMFRALNPTASSATDVEWENVTKGIDAGTYLNGLWLTEGSNVLWGFNGQDVWTYEDTLTGSVVLASPDDGGSSDRTDEVSLGWDKMDGASYYEYRVNSDPGFKGTAKQPGTPETKLTEAGVDGLSDGHTYYWKVRVMTPILSRWSEVWSFTTGIAGAQWHPFADAENVAPVPGATGVQLQPTFQWNPADWATGYEFELSAAADYSSPIVSKTGANALTSAVWGLEQALDYSTPYYWRVKAVSKTTDSVWANGTFTTMAKPAAPPPAPTTSAAPPPVVVEEVAPAYIWAIIGVGAALVIAVIVLIVRTRRVV